LLSIWNFYALSKYQSVDDPFAGIDWWHRMAQVLTFKRSADDRASEQRNLVVVPTPDFETGFWPEVSSHISSEPPREVNTRNSISRVLFEMSCVLAAAGALVVAISSIVQAPVIH